MSRTAQTRRLPAAALLAASLGAALALPARAEPFPRLLPLDQLLSEETRPEPRLSLDGVAPLLDRATRLRARAEALRSRTPIDPTTRARIAAAAQRSGP